MGQQYALAEASYVLVRLFQRFDSIECEPGKESQSHDDIEFKQMSSLTIQGGCYVKIE